MGLAQMPWRQCPMNFSRMPRLQLRRSSPVRRHSSWLMYFVRANVVAVSVSLTSSGMIAAERPLRGLPVEVDTWGTFSGAGGPLAPEAQYVGLQKAILASQRSEEC